MSYDKPVCACALCAMFRGDPDTSNEHRIDVLAEKLAAAEAESERLKQLALHWAGVAEAATKERDALAAFKAYVHQRLDAAGVPVDPPSTHREAGCRIGGRLDVVLGAIRARGEPIPQTGVIPAPKPEDDRGTK